MDWAGQAAAAWQVVSGLQREPWFAASTVALAAFLLLLWLMALLRIRALKQRLIAQTHPSTTFVQAILATRQARGVVGAGLVAPPPPGQRAGADPSAAASDVPQTNARQRVRGPRHAAGEPCLVKIYVDGSNLQENWDHIQSRNGLLEPPGVDWDALPRFIMDEMTRRPALAGRQIVYAGAHVYGSYFPPQYYDLLQKLEVGAIRSIPIPYMEFRRGRVRADITRQLPAGHPDRDAEIERQVTARMLAELEEWRRQNDAQIDLLTRGLPNRFGYRSFPFERRIRRDLKKARYNSSGLPQAEEKGLDVHCCTDLMADAAFDMFDVAVIVTNDSDFVPAITFVRAELGKMVIQLGPRGMSEAVRAACSGHIELDDFVALTNASQGHGRVSRTGRPSPSTASATPTQSSAAPMAPVPPMPPASPDAIASAVVPAEQAIPQALPVVRSA